MYRLLILIFLLSSCSLTPVEEEPPQINYGEYMFPMTCIWGDGSPDESNITGTIVWCFAHDISSEIIEADFFSLSVQYPEDEDERISVCGKNLYLYSGHSLYDSVLPIITNDQFGCIKAFDRIKNDEFDWFWYETCTWLLKSQNMALIPTQMDTRQILQYIFRRNLDRLILYAIIDNRNRLNNDLNKKLIYGRK